MIPLFIRRKALLPFFSFFFFLIQIFHFPLDVLLKRYYSTSAELKYFLSKDKLYLHVCVYVDVQ